jgi:hypothetical protein
MSEDTSTTKIDGLPVPEAAAEPALPERLEAARAGLTRRARQSAALEKAFAVLVRQTARLEHSPREVLEAVAAVRLLAAEAGLEPLLVEIEALARAAVERSRLKFGTALAAALAQRLPEGPELRPLDSGYDYGAVRILPDPASGRVALEYARLPVIKNLGADPETVAGGVAKLVHELDEPPLEPEFFLARMHAAYVQCAAHAGKSPGETVDLLDFWRRLAIEMQPEAFRRDPSARRFRDYPMHRFAHDLWRLRQARKFEHAGKRLELQTAVHDRAYGKSLWVPGEKTGGAFYQAIAFR